ncbi:hypothetical protein KKI95_19710 [Xenorhabdus bovienii]|uniref:AidA/PixA family protein n=1 Tax=Xenorhabdus bovienii TaxID=40576 RepID=UPI0023B2519F|nr:AidA/PixA family protein [Xenorhabdus bovienii]MDE9438063.1 hypothetical protein [Xenorhabdus bovienii]MDE9499885.1 hypothetical protein [Xenorhabdus bovienii]
MSDINLSIALNLNEIVNLGIYYPAESTKAPQINDKYVHLLSLNGNSFQDYGGKDATIDDIQLDDKVNLTVVNYAEYNSVLSAVLINYTVENPKNFVSTPKVSLQSVNRQIITDSINIESSMMPTIAQLYYWTYDIKGFNNAETFKGLLKIYKDKAELGYAYFKHSMTFKP